MDKIKILESISGLESPQSKRLATFCHARQTDRTKAIFDDRMFSILEGVVKDRKFLHNVKDHLDKVGFCQSKYESSVLQNNLEKYKQPNHVYMGWNKHYRKALADTIREFRDVCLQPISYTEEKFMAIVPKTDTHAGFIAIETGCRTKGENLESIWRNWRLIEEEAISNKSMNRVILPGTRTQASIKLKDGHFSGEWKSKTRLVQIVDLIVIMMESMFARPFQRYVSDKVSWYAGGKTPSDIRNKVLSCLGEYGNSITIDYSGYDHSISNWLIYDAFAVIKSAFKSMNDKQTKLFDVIVNDFINKAMLDINGNIIFANKGVPSGSMFTQIIDSIVNIIMVRTYMNARDIKRSDCMIMGDDNIIFTYDQIDTDDLAKYIQRMFGITVNSDKCSSAKYADHEVDFLSRTWRKDGEWRNPDELISKLLYPESMRCYDKYGFTPKQVLYSYFETFLLGMRDLCKPQIERDFFQEVSVESASSEKERFLTGLRRYQEQERKRRLSDKLIMQI